MWYRRKSNMHFVIRKRTSKRTNREQIRSQSKQRLLTRKRQIEAALFAVAITIGQVLAHTTSLSEKRKSQ